MIVHSRLKDEIISPSYHILYQAKWVKMISESPLDIYITHNTFNNAPIIETNRMQVTQWSIYVQNDPPFLPELFPTFTTLYHILTIIRANLYICLCTAVWVGSGFQSNNNNQCISSTSSFHCVPGLPNQYLVQVTTPELPV